MSMGYGGRAFVERETERSIIYRYCCINLNLKIYEMEDDCCTGEFCIRRPALEEYKQGASVAELLEEHKILISDAYESWARTDGIDIVGARLIWKVLDMYKENGTLPERVNVFW